MSSCGSNIIDYLTWRGDLSFEQAQFCEIDSLVLARMAYLPFESYASKGLTVAEAVKLFDSKARYLIEQDKKLAPMLAESARFSGVRILEIRTAFQKESEEQFCGFLVRLDACTLAFVFRGTDATIVGWKEDFNMGFTTPVPSQKDALVFVTECSRKYPEEKLILAGHSKGGNIAEYAALLCEKDIQDRIIRVTNFDGPGFDSNVINNDLYLSLKTRYHFVVPQSSIIGMLLKHGAKPLVVQSSYSGLMQHDLYSWQVQGTSFITQEGRTASSKFVDYTMKDWVCSLSVEERQKFVDVLFKSLMAYDKLTFKQFRHDWKQSIPLVYEQIKDMDPQTRSMMGRLLGHLILSAKNSIPEIRES